jgi:glyceraldehyde 3-phosphate dehydrogenase
MKKNIAINGVGRIGKNVFRRYFEQTPENCNLQAINLGSNNIAAKLHLLQYDSIHGKARINIEQVTADSIVVNGHKIQLVKERDINNINWADYNVDLVLECTGSFNNKTAAYQHIGQGAKKVIVSAPCTDAHSTIVIGANDENLASNHEVISIGSCTTNCLAPVAKILDDAFTIESGFVTTIHAYTNDQNLVDSSHKDLRRARSAALSMIPTTTGAAQSIGVVLPKLSGKLSGAAVRVPTQNVSMIDFVFNTKEATSADGINKLFQDRSNRDIVDFVNIPLVSIDHNHTTASAIFDCLETRVIQNKMARIVAWYDNEWAFSCRMLELAQRVLKL